MIHKFESWRTYRQASVANQCTMMHYYRLEDDSLRVVLRLLKAIVSQRVQRGRNSLYLSVSDEDVQRLPDILFWQKREAWTVLLPPLARINPKSLVL